MRLHISLIIAAVMIIGTINIAAADQEYTIVIKDHQFTPVVLKVSANEKFKLIVDNQDPTPEEFESKPLRREKVIGAGKKGIIMLGPLTAGTYEYVGEYHEDIAKGIIVVE